MSDNRIQFRLPEAPLQVLHQRARELGESPSKVASILLIEALQMPLEVEQRLDELHELVEHKFKESEARHQELRRDLANVLTEVLLRTTGCELEEVRSFVSTEFFETEPER